LGAAPLLSVLKTTARTPVWRRRDDQGTMDTEGKSKKTLADELESLQEQIAHLQSLILRHSAAVERSAENGLDRDFRDMQKQDLHEDDELGMATVDRQFRIVKTNEAFCRMLGYTEEEILSLTIQDAIQEKENCLQLVRQVLDGVLPFSKIEEQIATKTGEPLWVQFAVSALMVRDAKGCLVAIEDISDRKRAEASIQEEKQLLERLINSSVDGILAFDKDCFFTVWNPGMERIFGVGSDKTLGRNCFKALPFLKELGEEVNFEAALKGQKVISRDKKYMIPGTSRQGYFEAYYGPMYNPVNGEIIGGLAIFRDVTERRLAEEGKRISEERYRELFENAYDMVYTHDLTGKITSINKAAERITGYDRAEALQMRFTQFVASEFQQTARRMIDRQVADGAPITQELEIIAKNGNRVTLDVSNRLIFREGRPIGIQGIARDITERKKTEEALQHAKEKLEAWIRELEQRTREMTSLSEMGDILRACLTTEEVYEVIVRVAQEIFPVQGGALYVIGPLRNIVEAVAEWGDTSAMELTFTPDECWALRRGRVHWVEDSDLGLLCKHFHSPPPRGYLCVPMMAQSEAVGVLHLAQPDDAQMPEAKQRLAVAMAEHVAMALSNLRLHETLRSQSIRDQLTGLFNRSFMEESLELELRRSIRTQHLLSIIMLSLDDFQKINEKYGLDTGDSILRGTGTLLQTNVRKGDIACRYSGQTYVMILPQSSLEVSQKRAESLRELVRTLEIKNQSTHMGLLTASVGLAVFPGHGQTVETLLRSAEAALNRARGSGGDCVIVAN
jgi:diguanylate cyclase (GGDEF)-like protein/PAS domain S-box-containing protein